MEKSENYLKTYTIIIDAGFIGLAVAREFARKGDQVVILEKNPRAGEEINRGTVSNGI